MMESAIKFLEERAAEDPIACAALKLVRNKTAKEEEAVTIALVCYATGLDEMRKQLLSYMERHAMPTRMVVPVDRIVLCKHFQAAMDDGIVVARAGKVCRACHEAMSR